MAEADVLSGVWNPALAHLGIGPVSMKTDDTLPARVLNDNWDSFRKQYLQDYPFKGCKKPIDITSNVIDPHPTVYAEIGSYWSKAYQLPLPPPLILDILAVNPLRGQESSEEAWEKQQDPDDATRLVILTDAVRCVLLAVVDIQDEVQLLEPRSQQAMAASFAAWVAKNFGLNEADIQSLSRRGTQLSVTAKRVESKNKDAKLRRFLRAPLVEGRFRRDRRWLHRGY